MNAVLKIFLSMSVSGGLLILVLLLGKRFVKDKISRQWQYYIWLAVIIRLLFPFGPEISLLGKTYQIVDQAIIQAVPLSQQQSALNISGSNPASVAGIEPGRENVNLSADDPAMSTHSFQDAGKSLINHHTRAAGGGNLPLCPPLPRASAGRVCRRCNAGCGYHGGGLLLGPGFPLQHAGVRHSEAALPDPAGRLGGRVRRRTLLPLPLGTSF